MDNIKEAIAYIAELAVEAEKPEQIQINGRTYVPVPVVRLLPASEGLRGTFAL